MGSSAKSCDCGCAGKCACADKCDCGCADKKDKDRETGNGRPELDESLQVRIAELIAESRMKIGIKQFRRIRKVRAPDKSNSKAPSRIRKMYRPVRKGPRHNRHR